MPKPMTPSEEMVGRRLTAEPKHIDTIMAGFVKNRTAPEFCGRIKPGDRWLVPAHTKARRNGWLRASGVSLGKGLEIWYLTEKGEQAALDSYDRVEAIRAERHQWSKDWDAANRLRIAERVEAAAAENEAHGR